MRVEQQAENITYTDPNLLRCLPLLRRNWESLSINTGKIREFGIGWERSV